jgi:hypothetical protein
MTFIDVFSGRRLAQAGDINASFADRLLGLARRLASKLRVRRHGVPTRRQADDMGFHQTELEAARMFDPFSSSLTKIHGSARGPLA